MYHTIIIFSLTLILSLSSCFLEKKSNNEGSPIIKDPTSAGQKADDGFQAMIELAEKSYYKDINTKEEKDFSDVRSGEEIIIKADFNEIKKYFTDAISFDSDSPKANLGLAIIDIAELLYNETLWNFYNQIQDYKTSTVTFSSDEIDNIVENILIPAIDSAIEKLNITLSDPTFINISYKDTDNETHIVSKSEVYIFRSTLYFIKAGLTFITSYDLHLLNSNSSYSWISDLDFSEDKDTNNDYDYTTYSLEEVNSNNVLTLEKTKNETDRDNYTTIYKALKSSLLRSTFLQIKAGKDLLQMMSDVDSALSDMKSAYKLIMAQKGDVSNYLIKKSQVEDINEEIAKENIMDKNWITALEIIEWSQNALSNPFTVVMNNTEFTIDLSKLFNNEITDLENLFPFYRWKDETRWVEEKIDRVSNYYGELKDNNYTWFTENYTCGTYFDDTCWGDERFSDTDHWTSLPILNDGSIYTGTNNYYVYYNLFEMYSISKVPLKNILDNKYPVSKCIKNVTTYKVEPLEYLDAPEGTVLDGDIHFIFPDYTFNGLLPDMTQDTFNDIFFN